MCVQLDLWCVDALTHRDTVHRQEALNGKRDTVHRQEALNGKTERTGMIISQIRSNIHALRSYTGPGQDQENITNLERTTGKCQSQGKNLDSLLTNHLLVLYCTVHYIVSKYTTILLGDIISVHFKKEVSISREEFQIQIYRICLWKNSRKKIKII